MWSATRRKLFPVVCLIMNDIVVFLRLETSTSSQPEVAPAGNSLPLLGAHETQLSAAGSPAPPPHTSLGPQCAGAQQQALPAGPPPSQRHLAPTALTHWEHHWYGAAAPGGPELAQLHLQHQQADQLHHQGQLAASVRYHFANLDNKSSVISLGKLLVREKAVEEAEPRLYLISSSARQPEMYELAFVSRRHQHTFTEKVKSSVERYTQTSRRRWSSQLLLGQATSGGAAAPSSPSARGRLYAGSSSSSSSLERHSDGEPDDPETEFTLESGRSSRTASWEALCELHSNCCSTPTLGCHSSEPQGAPAASPNGAAPPRPRLDPLDLDHLKLDIEEDVVPEPAGHEDPRASRVGVAPAGSQSGCTDDEHEEEEDEDEALGCSALCERARDSCDESAGRAHCHAQPADQPGPLRLACGTPVAKMSRRRRRFAQRPRQVSNQSTSSSSAISSVSFSSSAGAPDTEGGAVGCQPAGCPSAKQDQDGAHSTATLRSSSHRHESGPSQEPLARSSGQDQAPVNNSSPATCCSDDAFDSGRGQDDSCSSSASSTHSSSVGLSLGVVSSSVDSCSARPPAQRAPQGGCPSSGAHSLVQHHCLGHQSSSTVGAKSASICLEAKKAAKQRKLSTVSTMSNQLKLICKLRSMGLSSQSSSSSSRNSCGAEGQPSSCVACCQCQTGVGPQASLSRASSVANGPRYMRRRSLFIPEQKLEELRDLRIQLDKDKQEWQEKFNRMQEELLNERRDLDLARERLKLDRQQVAHEREQLYRKLDILKEKGILLSPSNKVIITSPKICNYLQAQEQQQKQQQQMLVANSQMVSHNQRHHNQQQQHQMMMINGFFADQSKAQHNECPALLASPLTHRLSNGGPTNLAAGNYAAQGKQQTNAYDSLGRPNEHTKLMAMQQQYQAQAQGANNKMPIHLSQQTSPSANGNGNNNNTHRASLGSQFPFFGALPGASFFVSKFGGSSTSTSTSATTTTTSTSTSDNPNNDLGQAIYQSHLM